MPTPYAGNATSYPTAVNILSGSDAPNSTNFNTAWEGGLDRTAWLFANGMRCAQNWNPELAVNGTLGTNQLIEAAAWDPKLRQWIVCAVTNGGTPLALPYIGYGMDSGSLWTAVGSPVLPIGQPIIACAVSADPSTAGKYWLATSSSNGTTSGLNVYQYASGTWTQKYSDAGFHSDVQMCTLGTRIIFCECQTGTTNMTLQSSADNGATWQSTGFLQGATSYLLKSSGTQALAIAYGLTQTTFNYYATSDGVTWTTQHLSALDGGVQTVTGLTWGADLQGPCWLLTVQVTSTTTATYRSADGLAWTLVAAGASNLKQIGDIAYASGALVATLGDESSAGPSRMIWSPDGGLTWKPNDTWFSSNDTTSTSGYQRSRIVAGDTGFLAFNSVWMRISLRAGLPASLT